MANRTIEFKFRPYDDFTNGKKKKYVIYAFLKNQVIQNGKPDPSPYYHFGFGLDNKTTIVLGEILDVDTVIEIEFWAKTKVGNNILASKTLSITTADYLSDKEKSISIKIEEKTNPAGQLFRVCLLYTSRCV